MLHRIHECLPGAGVLVVDDGSPDGTAALVTAVAAELPDVHLLSRASKSGLGSAYRAGFAWGLERGYDACIEIDADFSHDPAALPTLVAPLDEGYDVVIGSRYVEGGSIPNWAWHRHLLSRWRQRLRVGRPRSRRGRFDGGLPGLLGPDPAPARPRPHPGRGLRVPDRDDVPVAPVRRRHHRSADQVRRPRGRRVEDVLVHRGRGARPGDVLGPRAGSCTACSIASAGSRRKSSSASAGSGGLGVVGASTNPGTGAHASAGAGAVAGSGAGQPVSAAATDSEDPVRSA